MDNRDSFGLDAAAYRQFRPRYPAELIRYLAEAAPDHRRALDCGTGNGQAAVDLAELFDHVDAVDSSDAQIAGALHHPRVSYRVAASESLPFEANSYSLVTAAQAAHWFDLSAFYREVDRVAVPGGIIAIWGYSYCRVAPEIDRVVETTLLQPIAPFWAQGNKVIAQKYGTIDFPFQELEWPDFSITYQWARLDYMQYLRTWSAVKKYAEEYGVDPVGALETALNDVWSEQKTADVTFDFVGRIGRIGRAGHRS